MSHANEYVLGIRDELRAAGFHVSQCVNIGDDPQGDFGIAWYSGIIDGCAQMRYDVGYLPSKHTVVHEFGHDMHSKWQGSDSLPLFWARMGIPYSYEEAFQQGAGGSQYERWRHTPSEILAEMFAWTVLGDYVQTATFGIQLTPFLRADLTALFRTFRDEEESMALTEADKADIAAMIAASEARLKQRIATGEVDILREVLGKLESGFNTTVSTFLDRQSAGDKKVATAPID